MVHEESKVGGNQLYTGVHLYTESKVGGNQLYTGVHLYTGQRQNVTHHCHSPTPIKNQVGLPLNNKGGCRLAKSDNICPTVLVPYTLVEIQISLLCLSAFVEIFNIYQSKQPICKMELFNEATVGPSVVRALP